jgi:hypothetical protein
MGRGKRSSQSMNTKMANGHASAREESSPKVEDDKISKLQNLNQILVKEIKSLREEKTILSENLTQMSSQIEAEHKMKDESKKVEKELRTELAKKETEYEVAISKAGTQLQEAQHKIQAISAESEATRTARELEKDELLSQIVDARKQIEAENKMKDEWKKIEKELREELAKKEREHEATISKAGTQLHDAQHKIQAISAESEATRTAWELEKDELLSQIVDVRKQIEAENKMKDESKKVEKELREELAKKETEYEATISKDGTQLQEAQHKIQAISAESEATRTAWELEKAELLSQIVDARKQIETENKMKDESKKVEKELREELAKKETEHEATISKARTQLQEAQHKIQAISAESEATRTARELEKDELLSQIVDARKETEAITQELLRKHDHTSKLQSLNQILEKEIRSLREKTTILVENVTQMSSQIEAVKKMKDESKEAEEELREELAMKETEHEAAMSKAGIQLQEARRKIQAISVESEETRKAWELEKDELLSRIEEARKETEAFAQELLRKNDQDRHLWDAFKRKSEGTISELQTKLELTATENKLLRHINEDLSSQVLSLMDQLRVCNAKLICIEDEKQMMKALSTSNVEKLEAMLTQKTTMENEIKRLQKDVDGTECFLETQKQRVEKTMAENGRLNKQQTHVSLLQGKEENGTIQSDGNGSHFHLLKNKGENGKSLRREDIHYSIYI